MTKMEPQTSNMLLYEQLTISSLQMVYLYYDPNGEKIFSNSVQRMSKSKEYNSQILNSKADHGVNQIPCNIEELKAKIKELEARVGHKHSLVNFDNIFQQFFSSLCLLYYCK